MRLLCQTLFDITRTNVSSRRYDNLNVKDSSIFKKRNQQSNYETILQVIGLRCQPENISEPTITKIQLKNSDNWGYIYDSGKTRISVWSFTFMINHSGVFNDGISELGNLHKDCDGVPIITGLDEWDKLKPRLTVSDEQRNIRFEVLHD
jgi:hypothetical protein